MFAGLWIDSAPLMSLRLSRIAKIHSSTPLSLSIGQNQVLSNSETPAHPSHRLAESQITPDISENLYLYLWAGYSRLLFRREILCEPYSSRKIE
jgi:hypothetical protein